MHSRCPSLFSVAVLAIALAPLPSLAAGRRVLQVDLDGSDSQAISDASRLIAVALGAHGYDLVSPSDAREAFGRTKKGTRCVDDASCLRRAAEKVQAELVLTGALAAEGKGYLLTLALAETTNLAGAQRTSESMRRIKSLSMNVDLCLARLFHWSEGAAAPPPAPPAAAPAPAMVEAPVAPAPEQPPPPPTPEPAIAPPPAAPTDAAATPAGVAAAPDAGTEPAEPVANITPEEDPPDPDPADIKSTQKQLRARSGALRGCYEDGLKNNPALAGKVTVRLEVALNGAVTEATFPESTLEAPTVLECIHDQAIHWLFEPLRGPVGLTLDLPMTFGTVK